MDQEYYNNLNKQTRLNKEKRHLTGKLIDLLEQYIELSEFGLIFEEISPYKKEIFLINKKKELGLITIPSGKNNHEIEIKLNEGTSEDLIYDLTTTCGFLEKSVSKNILKELVIKELPEVIAWFNNAALQEDNPQYSTIKKKTL